MEVSSNVELPIREYMNPIVIEESKLKNGLTCVYVSNPSTDLSSVCLLNPSGSFSDPDTANGLAHFTEHLLFLGSGEYPNQNNYREFVTARGGRCNAWTFWQFCIFHFEIPQKYLAETLNVLVEQIRDPLFDEDNAMREIWAVNSEHDSVKRKNLSRFQAILRDLSKRNCGYSRYLLGNLSTLGVLKDGVKLKDIQGADNEDFHQDAADCDGVFHMNVHPDSNCIDRDKFSLLMENVRKQHRKMFNAKRMICTVVSPLSIQVLKEEISPILEKIDIENIHNDDNQEINPMKNYGFLVKFRPITLWNFTGMIFYVSDQSKSLSKPLSFLSYLSSSKNQGSLYSRLKQRKMIYNVFSYYDTAIGLFSNFELRITLTKKGIELYEEVLEEIADYIKYLVRLAKEESLELRMLLANWIKKRKIEILRPEELCPLDLATRIAKNTFKHSPRNQLDYLYSDRVPRGTSSPGDSATIADYFEVKEDYIELAFKELKMLILQLQSQNVVFVAAGDMVEINEKEQITESVFGAKYQIEKGEFVDRLKKQLDDCKDNEIIKRIENDSNNPLDNYKEDNHTHTGGIAFDISFQSTYSGEFFPNNTFALPTLPATPYFSFESYLCDPINKELVEQSGCCIYASQRLIAHIVPSPRHPSTIRVEFFLPGMSSTSRRSVQEYCSLVQSTLANRISGNRADLGVFEIRQKSYGFNVLIKGRFRKLCIDIFNEFVGVLTTMEVIALQKSGTGAVNEENRIPESHIDMCLQQLQYCLNLDNDTPGNKFSPIANNIMFVCKQVAGSRIFTVFKGMFEEGNIRICCNNLELSLSNSTPVRIYPFIKRIAKVPTSDLNKKRVLMKASRKGDPNSSLLYFFQTEVIDFTSFYFGKCSTNSIPANYRMAKLFTLIAHHLLQERFFNKLRTEQKSGYHCYSRVVQNSGLLGVAYFLQSADICPAELAQRIEHFIQEKHGEEILQILSVDELLSIIKNKPKRKTYSNQVGGLSTPETLLLNDSLTNELIFEEGVFEDKVTKEEIREFMEVFYQSKSKTLQIHFISSKHEPKQKSLGVDYFKKGGYRESWELRNDLELYSDWVGKSVYRWNKV